jgi:peptidylprolyl isomerase
MRTPTRRDALFAFTAGAFGLFTPARAQLVTTSASGLKIIDIKVGTGPSPKSGQTCVMHYTGWLYENGAKGKKFDSSVDRGQPFEFPIGTGRVFKGWDEGVATMKVGGKRTLIIPPELGYGAQGAGRRHSAERNAHLRRRAARRERLAGRTVACVQPPSSAGGGIRVSWKPRACMM